MSEPPPATPPSGASSQAPAPAESPVPEWWARAVTPGAWIVAVILTLGQATALYDAGGTTGRWAGPVIDWPTDVAWAQGPIGWLLVAALLVAGRRRRRDAVGPRVCLALGLLSLASFIIARLWQRPEALGWWTVGLVLGAAVHAFALYLIGLLALERGPAPTETAEQSPDHVDEATPSGPAPVWQPSAASGRAWTRAGDAATGAGPSHVGRPPAEGELGDSGSPDVDTRRLGPAPSAGYQVPLPGQSPQPSGPTATTPGWQRSGSPWPKRDEADPEGTLRRPPASPYHPPTPPRW